MSKNRAFFGGLEHAFQRFLRRMPRQSRSRSLVDALLIAFDDQVAKTDLDDVTIEALTDRAGVGVGSFYEYFSGRDSLLGASIGRVTRHNFETLAAEIEALDQPTLQEAIRAVSAKVAGVYMAHPKRMRAIVDGICKLGLLHTVNHERDRFSAVMAKRAHIYAPHIPQDELECTMRLVADAIMGVLVSAASRDTPPPDDLAEQLGMVANGIVEKRHGLAATDVSPASSSSPNAPSS